MIWVDNSFETVCVDVFLAQNAIEHLREAYLFNEIKLLALIEQYGGSWSQESMLCLNI